MTWFTNLLGTLNATTLFFTWRDVLEICIFSFMSYGVIRLLAQDKQKRLLPTFYLYCTLFACAFFFNITGLLIVLAIGAPIVAMLFITMHQRTLQKNFIQLTSLAPQPEKVAEWLDVLLQSALHGLNQNKSLVVILERSQSLESLLTASCTLHAPISDQLLTILLKASSAEEPIVLWVNQAGKIHALNPTSTIPYESTWLSEELQSLDRFKQDGFIITEKSDAIIWMLSPTTRLFTLIAGGKIFERLSVTALMSTITKMLATPQITKEEYTHGISNWKNRTRQQPRA